MSDDGFHEIQLNGKQLIFLFMAAALVLVVAFLSGVLVGRGVHARKDAALTADAMAEPSAAAGEAAPSPGAAAPATELADAPPITAIPPPTPADEELSYNSRLEDAQPPSEVLKAPAPPAASEPPAPKPAPKAAAPGKAKPEAALPGDPGGSGYYLKVVAYRDRGQAASVATRLAGKGYGAYVVPLAGRGATLYSVRVGKFKSRREADAAKRRLEKEEQFKPLISH